MIWMVFSELIPEAMDKASGEAVGISVTVAMVGLWAFQMVLLGHA
jgi:hypothetical protein